MSSDTSELALRLALASLGTAVVLAALRSAVRTFVLPRSRGDPLALGVFLLVRRVFAARVRRARTFAARDRAMLLYAPTALVALALVWVGAVIAGFTALFRAAEGPPWSAAFVHSGSALLTLGIARPATLAGTAVAFAGATVGLSLVALLIAYLPLMYGAYSRREAAVTLLSMRGGSPPAGAELLVRLHRLDLLRRLPEFWARWEEWFIELEESHTSLAPIAFFRSSHAGRSWVTAAGAVLDAAALRLAVLDLPHRADADLCLRVGTATLWEVAALFRLPTGPAEGPDAGVSISRIEFDAVRARLTAAGLPVRPDAGESWREFERARGAYDVALLNLAALTMAPYAPWSSDRSLLQRRGS